VYTHTHTNRVKNLFLFCAINGVDFSYPKKVMAK
jgi:hypothetical protein